MEYIPKSRYFTFFTCSTSLYYSVPFPAIPKRCILSTYYLLHVYYFVFAGLLLALSFLLFLLACLLSLQLSITITSLIVYIISIFILSPFFPFSLFWNNKGMSENNKTGKDKRITKKDIINISIE